MILWHDTAKAGEVDISAHLFDTGTHILSFEQHSSSREGGRYMSMTLHLTEADIDALAGVLERMKAARVIMPAPTPEAR